MTFFLALVQPGAEQALVDETGLSRAYSKKGLVTLKSPRDLGIDDVPMPVFARHIGLSLGKVTGEAEARAAAEALGLKPDLVAEAGARPPRPGEIVLTVVDEWATVHRHAPGRSPFPRGVIDIPTPTAAPSRAWLKLEEAIRTFELPVQAGQEAIDIGCAPGGATYNLLNRGLEVVGIDPNEMRLQHAHFDHIRRTSTSVDPAPADWVLLDVNVPPGTALRGAMPFIERARVGIVLTLKMKDWSLAREVPGWLRRLTNFDLIARQLSSNGQEICVAGLRSHVAQKL